ncbi:EAL domain-containing protein [Pseudomonas atacamensis]|uniref:EAL domain-containing protein n=1 Tax=Pseudomonas atacamensis TaxID=2565368 RepID=UPI001C3C982D|nr:EAL domain-containing protein [Pseudomonas atacamensis]QXH74833.1 EAL domain-containing protein [Pseudomonas atacamensis]
MFFSLSEFIVVLHRLHRFPIVMWVVLITGLAGAAAHAASHYYAMHRMNAINSRVQLSLNDIDHQVNDALIGMSALNSQEENCSENIYSTISKLVFRNQWIYEAAFKLANGKICSSYGREILELPSRFGWNYFLLQQSAYPLILERQIFTNENFVIAKQVSIYLWLNKDILLGYVNSDVGIGLDVIDPQLKTTVLSNGIAKFDPNGDIEFGKPSRQERGLHMAYHNQSHGFVTIITFPSKQFQIVWWTIFVIVLVLLFLLYKLLALFRNWVMERCFSLVAKLKRGIKNDELSMAYQPIVDLRTGEWVGMEALIRWSQHGNIISPCIFVPLAERSGIIRELTRWVVGRVAADFSRHFRSCKGLYITINLSVQDIEDHSFVDFVYELFSRNNIPPQRIVFEVTEGALMNRPRGALQLQRLRERGHRIAIDDFGTGYSSLAQIEELPVDILKLDRSFIGVDKINAPDALWRHIVSIASSLRLTVVAEGVETPDQVEALIDGDVKFCQGWLFSKALPPAVFAKHFNSINSSKCYI